MFHWNILGHKLAKHHISFKSVSMVSFCFIKKHHKLPYPGTTMFYLFYLSLTFPRFSLSNAFTITAIIQTLTIFQKIYHLPSWNTSVGFPPYID